MIKRLSVLRKHLGYKTQKDFAKTLDIPWRTLQVYEQGITSIPSSFLKKLQEHFGVSFNWLFYGEGEMFIHSECHVKPFMNSNLILKALTQEEISGALVCTYIEKLITPHFKDIQYEKAFWAAVLDGHKNHADALYCFFDCLEDINIKRCNLSNAKNQLEIFLNLYYETLLNQFKMIFPTKDTLSEIIRQSDDLACYIIISNSRKMLEVLSDLRTPHYRTRK